MSIEIPGRDVRGDAERVFEVVKNGGIALIPLDLNYAVMCRTEEGVRRIYAAKRRSFEKPTGMLGTIDLHREVHVLGARESAMVASITQKHNLPLGVIAPFRADHPHLLRCQPFVLGNALKNNTLNILLNAGELREHIARMSVAEGIPLVGSSANVSLQGTKFRLEDVEPEIRAIADIEIDYGLCHYHADPNRSSTMINFATLHVQRVGVAFAKIVEILRDEFGVELPKPAG